MAEKKTATSEIYVLYVGVSSGEMFRQIYPRRKALIDESAEHGYGYGPRR